MDDNAEVERVIDALPQEQRDHLKTLIFNLVMAFDAKQEHRQALIIFFDTDRDVIGIGTANMNEMEAAELLMRMAQMAEARAMQDAPPKEMFN